MVMMVVVLLTNRIWNLKAKHIVLLCQSDYSKTHVFNFFKQIQSKNFKINTIDVTLLLDFDNHWPILTVMFNASENCN